MSENMAAPLRILIVDDEAPVLDAYRRILRPPEAPSELRRQMDQLEAGLFGGLPGAEEGTSFDLTLCHQGDEAVTMVKQALDEGKPFAVGFLDVRMPPGPDGVQTGEWLRDLDPNMQLVFVTAFSDYEPQEINERIQPPDQLFYVQKPLRPQELRQFALALCSRWHAERSLDANEVQLLDINQQLRQEVAERKLAEARLQELLALHKMVSDNVPSSLLVVDEQLSVVMANEKLQRHSTTGSWQVTGQKLGAVLPPALLGRAELPSRLARLAAAGGNDEELGLRLAQPDGTSQYLDLRMCGFKVSPAEQSRMLLVIDDVTQQRQLEEQVHLAARQDSLGRVAGGVAHDFNNLLAAISGYVELVENRLADEQSRGYLEQVIQAVQKGSALTKQLLTFGRRQPLEMQVLNPGAMLAELSDMLRRLLGESIELRLDLDPDLANVRADKSQLEQVVVNLAVNARDAMGDGGLLTIAAMNVSLDEEAVRAHPGLQPGGHVMLQVSDNGVGMDEQTLEKIFEPFYTTKGVGKGTGLGLAMAYSCIQQHGGHIEVSSEPGQGSTFTICLPQAHEAPQASAGPQPVTDLADVPGSGVILLVEDEPAVRGIVQATLENAGYSVIPAASPQEALALDEAREVHPDLLLTDVVMPGMNGLDLHLRLLGSHPNMRVMFMSGYTDEIISRAPGNVNEAAFIQKPFSCRALTQKVREALGEPEPLRAKVA